MGAPNVRESHAESDLRPGLGLRSACRGTVGVGGPPWVTRPVSVAGWRATLCGRWAARGARWLRDQGGWRGRPRSRRSAQPPPACGPRTSASPSTSSHSRSMSKALHGRRPATSVDSSARTTGTLSGPPTTRTSTSWAPSAWTSPANWPNLTPAATGPCARHQRWWTWMTQTA